MTFAMIDSLAAVARALSLEAQLNRLRELLAADDQPQPSRRTT